VEDRPSVEVEEEAISVTDQNWQNPSDPSQEQFVRSLGLLLMHMSSLASGASLESPFQSVSLPKVSISSYSSRIYKYLRCTDECFVLCMVYIDRVVKAHQGLEVTDLTCHRLFFISAVVAAKFHDDMYAGNDYFAKVGGLDLEELNALEAEFLQLLDWKLYVGASEYNSKLQTLRGMS
jgi:hypothetical protein